VVRASDVVASSGLSVTEVVAALAALAASGALERVAPGRYRAVRTR
jgi:hypothetical protein